jgi:chromosome segregation ATPase
MKLWFCGLVIAALLVLGGVEINPGPFSIEEEVQICEFITETKSKDLEVRGFMERIKKSLSGINMVITVLSEKMDESNKAVKGLKEGWNKMQLELDELKKRQDNWEWKRESWEEEARKNNLIVFGLEERNGERYEDTLKIVEQLIMKKIGVQEIQGHVDYVKRIGRSRDNRPIFVKFTTFLKKLKC